MNGYRTLFTGTLVQDSALSVGGSSVGASGMDDPLCRDGRNRLTLRGSTLAGALIATARKIDPNLPPEISSGNPSTSPDTPATRSLWQFFNSHPESEILETRQGVGIRQDTGAAAEGVLFDVETLARGTKWPFYLEVNTRGEKGKKAEELAAAALLEWSRGRCWIGRNVARGLGWLHLQNLQAWRLDTDDIDLWPDSSRTLKEAVDEVKKALKTPVDKNDFATTFKLSSPAGNWHYLEIEGDLVTGKRKDGYGLDALSIGGHAANQSLLQWDNHFLKPEGQTEAARKDAFDTDFAIVMTRRANDDVEPFIPGSALRGPMRHALSRQLRRQGKTIRDPNVRVNGSNPPDDSADDSADVEQWFGNFERSARLLVRDAYLDETAPTWNAAWLQHHAGDEFAGGVFGSSKFDRVVLLDGKFKWKMVIEAENKEMADNAWQSFQTLRKLGEAGHLPVGGGQWRGFGWIRWENITVRSGKAGEDAQ